MYKIILLFAVILLCSHSISYAENVELNFDLEEEEYVDDIPFNTSDIISFDRDTNRDANISVSELEFKAKMIIIGTPMNVNFQMNEEEYINDILFDTESIIVGFPIYFNLTLIEALNVEFQLEVEEYVDDIPFKTECVIINDPDCSELNFDEALNVGFPCEDEEYIDVICN